MSLEDITAGNTIANMIITNPADGDSPSQGDDHIRNMKKAIQYTFPNISATASGVAAEFAFAHKGGTVSGNAVILGNITGAGTLSVSGAAVIHGALQVNSTLSVSGNAVVTGTTIANGALQANSTLSVSGNAVICGIKISRANVASTTANIIVSNHTLASNTTGAYNNAFGYGALTNNTTGTSDSAFGYNALGNNTTGSYDNAFGYNALGANTTGEFDNAFGYNALGANTTGFSDSAFGHNALGNNTTGSYDNAFGHNALAANTTGSYNSAFGYGALSSVTTETNCSGLGYNAQVTASNQVQLGDSFTTTYAYGAVQNRSDVRDKTNITDTALGLSFVMMLRPRDYSFNYRERYRVINTDGTVTELKNDGSKAGKRKHHGFIAQEVKQIIDATGVDFGGYQDHSINGGKDVLSIGYDELIAPMVKAIQELKQEIDAMKKKMVEHGILT